MSKWVCTVCGYEIVADISPDFCPVCKAPKSRIRKALEIGDVCQGLIEQVFPFGVKVDLGNGRTGVVHESKLLFNREKTRIRLTGFLYASA